MALTHEDLEILKRRFEVDEHEFHRGNVYLRENAITDRIELVDPSWTADVIQLDRRTTADGKLMVVILMRVTISGVFRDGIGQAEVVMTSKGGEANEPEKSAATDALKRAVRLFGVGRYLLDVPKEVSDYAGLRAHFNGSKPGKNNVPQSKGKTPPQYAENRSTPPTAPNNGNQQKSWTEAQARAFMDIARHHGHQPKDVQNYLNVGRLGDWKGSITDAFNRLLECAPITDSEVMADWLTFIETQEAVS